MGFRRSEARKGYPGAERNGHHDEPAGIAYVRASDIVPTSVRWLWEGRIPRGKLTMFDGDPDLGKSVVTVDIAARVSTGRGFPDGATVEAANVLLCNVEDGAGDTIVPRLMAHGANLAKVCLFSTVPDGRDGKRLLELPGDVPILEDLVINTEAELLIIDPVMTMLGGDANKDQDARKALSPLAEMADRTGVAVIAVRHLNKSIGLKAIQRGGGNMGLIGVARAGSYFAEHPDDDRLRIMAPHKSNLAEKPPSLAYRVVGSEVHHAARVEWTGVTEYDANNLAADASTPHEKSQLQEAQEFLADELKDGPVWAKQIFKDARDAGISDVTLKRAKATMRVRSEKIGTEGWSWNLPGRERRQDEGDHEGDHEEDHHPPDDPLEPLEPLDTLPINKGNWDGNKSLQVEGDQEDQGDHPSVIEPLRGRPVVDAGRVRVALEALECGNGPRKVLGEFREGRADAKRLARSVAFFYQRPTDEADTWVEPVLCAVEVLRKREEAP